MDPLRNHFPPEKINTRIASSDLRQQTHLTCLQLPYDVLLMYPLWFMVTDATMEINKEEVSPHQIQYNRGLGGGVSSLGCWAEFSHKTHFNQENEAISVLMLMTNQANCVRKYCRSL